MSVDDRIFYCFDNMDMKGMLDVAILYVKGMLPTLPTLPKLHDVMLGPTAVINVRLIQIFLLM